MTITKTETLKDEGIAAILNIAAWGVERRGWARTNCSNGPFCVVGAVGWAAAVAFQRAAPGRSDRPHFPRRGCDSASTRSSTACCSRSGRRLATTGCPGTTGARSPAPTRSAGRT